MRLVTFGVNGQDRIGVLLEAKIIDINLAYTAFLYASGDPKAYEIASVRIPTSMVDFLSGEDISMEAAKKTIEYVKENPGLEGPKGEKISYGKGEVKLKAPLRPNKVMHLGINHSDTLEMIRKGGSRIPDAPMLFLKSKNAVIGDGEDIVLVRRDESQATTVEVELGLVIGKRCRMVPAEKAYDYIAGYTVTNDITAQEYVDPWIFKKTMGEMLLGRKLPTEKTEFITSPMVKNKSFDTWLPIGPCIITKDEIPDPYDPPLHYQCKVNGEIAQEGLSSDLRWKIPITIETYSRIMTLEPGDLISTGTCQITAKALVKPGDLVETTIKEIGTFTNRCIAWDDFAKSGASQ